MREVAAYSTFAVTVGLVLTGPRLRLGPWAAALIGLVAMLLFGLLDPLRAIEVALPLGRPLVAVAAIMITTSAAERMGVLDGLAAQVARRAAGSRLRFFRGVFVLAAATSALLNNDAAVLVLTPAVVATARRLAPGDDRFTTACAFAVFGAAGVAPLVVANPMNLIVATAAGIGFLEYAARMTPVAIAGGLVTYVLLRWLFRRALAGEMARRDHAVPLPGAASLFGLLALLLVAYPIVTGLGGPVWAVSLAGAAGAVAIAARRGAARPLDLVLSGPSWEVLGFFALVFVLAHGLRDAGVVDRLASLYAGAGPGGVGVASAVGSALLNNHPMAALNLLALEQAGAGRTAILAALVGGDLGPRLLPMGSLAGLLWLASLAQKGVTIPLRRFLFVGAVVTLPTLAVSLAVLTLL